MKSNIINIFILYVIFISYSCNGGGDCAYSTTCEGLYYGDYNVKDSTQYFLALVGVAHRIVRGSPTSK
ncbi:MAG: hypothetical protein EBZ58_06980 [Bacteroidetes bacterium]|nr:hypothetical protein [Bacteroidota bacterium]